MAYTLKYTKRDFGLLMTRDGHWVSHVTKDIEKVLYWL